MAAHSSVLAWRIPGTGKPGGLPSMGLHRVGHDWSDSAPADGFLAAPRLISSCLNLPFGTRENVIEAGVLATRNGRQKGFRAQEPHRVLLGLRVTQSVTMGTWTGNEGCLTLRSIPLHTPPLEPDSAPSLAVGATVSGAPGITVIFLCCLLYGLIFFPPWNDSGPEASAIKLFFLTSLLYSVIWRASFMPVPATCQWPSIYDSSSNILQRFQSLHSHYLLDIANRWGNNGNSVRLYFGGLQNHCRWWLKPWN